MSSVTRDSVPDDSSTSMRQGARERTRPLLLNAQTLTLVHGECRLLHGSGPLEGLATLRAMKENYVAAFLGELNTKP